MALESDVEFTPVYTLTIDGVNHMPVMLNDPVVATIVWNVPIFVVIVDEGRFLNAKEASSVSFTLPYDWSATFMTGIFKLSPVCVQGSFAGSHWSVPSWIVLLFVK